MTAGATPKPISGGRSLLVWRAIKWRAGSSAMFFLVAVAAIVAAAGGPIYLRAADQSLVTSRLAASQSVRTGLTLLPEGGAYVAPSHLRADAESVPGGAGPSPRDAFESPIITLVTQAEFPSISGRPDVMDLVARTGSCAHLHMVGGHCPLGARQVAISRRTARVLRTHLGGHLVAPAPGGKVLRLEVVGLYLPGAARSSYWWQQNYFAFGSTVNKLQAVDAGFMGLKGATSLPTGFGVSDFAQVGLRPASVAAPSVPSLLAGLSSWSDTIATRKGVRVGTRLPQVLSSAQAQEHSASTIIAIISLQLVLLVLFVLYAVAKSTNALRASDIRVAELRGYSRARIAWLALREPTLLLLAALPVGILLSYAVLSFVDGHVLGPDAVTLLDSLAVETAVFGCLGGVVAAALGSRALLSGNSFLESSTAARQRSVRNSALLDVLGLALAAAGIAEMVGANSSGSGTVSPLAYLGPGLVALGAGILASRLVPFAGRVVGRAYAWSKAPAVTLASRSIARRDLYARQVLVPSIATGLLVFGVVGLSVARLNQGRQAGYLVGAPFVMHVSPRPGVDLLQAVRKADPSGHEAMAVVVEKASNGDTLMVDSKRFASIASWPSAMTSLSAAQIGRLLASPAPPARLLPPGSKLQMSVTSPSSIRPGPVLSATLFGFATQSELTVSLGRLREGTHRYNARLFGLCSGECRLDGISLSWHMPRGETAASRARLGRLASNYSLRLDSAAMVSGGRAVPAAMGFGKAGYWRSSLGLRPRPNGLVVTADLLRSRLSLRPYDLPSVLPAVASRDVVNLDATPGNPRQVLAIGLDGSNLTSRADVIVPAIPRLGNEATMIDLGLAEAAVGTTYSQTSFEVWCKRAPSRQLIGSLARQGVKLDSIERASAERALLARSGPSFGFDLYGMAALAAALLALGALLFSIASSTRERRIEIASLSAVGVPRRHQLRSLLIETTAVSLTGAVVGTLAAVISASLALSFLPEFPAGRVGPPLLTGLPWPAVLLTALAMFVLLELAGVIGNLLLVRGVRPELMRLSR